jgi:broad specificity phosphatase PhoE
MRTSILSRAFVTAAEVVDRAIGWHRLPRPLGLLTLIGIRDRLRERNLHDTGLPPPERTEPTPRELAARTSLELLAAGNVNYIWPHRDGADSSQRQ